MATSDSQHSNDKETAADVPTITSDERLDPFGRPLVPSTTSDSLDPLNWSSTRKYTILIIVCYSYFLLTYLTSTPIPSFFLLMDQFNASYSVVNWTFGISTLGLAAGPLLTASIAEIYGRRVVMIVSTAIALVASGCTAIHTTNIGGYMAARFFQGFGAGPACNVGLSIINDISWEHQRGLRVGLWAMSANIGSLLGGVTGGFLALASQYWVGYHMAILYGVLILLEIFFLPETLYPREHTLRLEHGSSSAVSSEIKKTKQLGLLNLRKIPGVKHPKPYDTFITFYKLWAYPNVVISICGCVLFQYWWIVTIMTMEPLAYENYETQVQGLFFIGLLLGVIFAEVFCSGWLSDRIVARLTARNGGKRSPEMRLWLAYPAAISSTIGLIVWGVSVDRQWHWMTGQVAFFLFALGMQMGNAVATTYIVECYPEYAIETVTYYGVIINVAAFVNPWFIADWTAAVGFTWSFGTQGIICSACLIPAYAFLHKFGRRLWKPPKFAAVESQTLDGNPEVLEAEVTESAISEKAKV